MLTDIQKENAVSFYSKWPDDKLVSRLDYFESSIEKQKADKRAKHTTIVKDQRFVDLLYYTLEQRGYFE